MSFAGDDRIQQEQRINAVQDALAPSGSQMPEAHEAMSSGGRFRNTFKLSELDNPLVENSLRAVSQPGNPSRGLCRLTHLPKFAIESRLANSEQASRFEGPTIRSLVGCKDQCTFGFGHRRELVRVAVRQ